AEIVAIVGASGSGKTTLLNILAGYDAPSAGYVWVGGRDLLRISGGGVEEYRRKEVGFVWQQTGRNLLPYLTSQENVELPMLLAGMLPRERSQRAKELLELVGLGPRRAHRPEQLSGGEQQRVAVAIAMANNPPLLLADEPTGELDSQTASEIFALFRSVRETYGTTVVIVTHDPDVLRVVDRVVVIRDGKTSAELLALPTFQRRGQEGDGLRSQEFMLVDTSGRLQIPREFLEKLQIHERAVVSLEGDRITVRPEG
ncbi:MAG: ATP-binding cassette domain-containing protein, partial [Chloroflexi bacterium]|nr:ATP-binding cassette domain-containing protein [Chloroflexota bacterium]